MSPEFGRDNLKFCGDNLTIIALRALKDNYIWLIHDQINALVIDPTLDSPVLNYLSTHQLQLQAILLTHAHADHTAGVAGLCAKYHSQVIDNFQSALSDGQSFDFAGFPAVEVVLTPGHTFEHVTYLLGGRHLFCGDTLFAQGCGRVFTNDYPLMHSSLNKIARLPDEVLCYPAHEYTLNNLRFTQQVDRDKSYYALYAQYLLYKITNLNISLPTLLADEKKYNLFLRCDDPEVWAKVAAASNTPINNSLACFMALRELRNTF